MTLPATLAGKITSDSIYLADIQASFPNVNWATLDRLYIPAGHYKFIYIGNLPQRSADRRLVISNSGGQVRVGGLGHQYLMRLSGGSNWVLSGRHDPQSLTGHANFPGHRGGAFAHSQGTYGFLIDDAFVRDGVSGLAVFGGATAFEIEFVEIARVDFAGMLIKTDNNAAATMSGLSLHDNYVHDTRSEGMYIGSTQGQPQHQVRDLKLYNNRILRTGTEAVQIGQLGGTNEVHNNVFGPAAIDWRAAFGTYQDNTLQIGVREGHTKVRDNLLIGSANAGLYLYATAVGGDATAGDVGVTVSNNLFSHMRNLGLYVDDVVLAGMTYRFENNVWRQWRFERNEVYPSATAYDHLLRSANASTPTIFTGNVWDGPAKFSNRLASGAGTSGNVSGISNTRAAAAAFAFVDAGLPDDFDWLRLEMWTDVASLNGNAPVSYPQGDVVMHNGLPYRCRLSPCPAGVVPAGNPATWEPLQVFADDVRLRSGSPYAGMGLTPLD